MRNCPTYRRDIVRTMSTINEYEEMNGVVSSAYLCVPLRLCGELNFFTAEAQRNAEERRDGLHGGQKDADTSFLIRRVA